MGKSQNDSHKPLALVVDDEAPLRSIIAFDIEERGFEVRETESVEAAIEMMTKVPFDVLITDLRFPTSSGLDLARWVHGRTGPRPAVVVVSGEVSTEMRKELAACGVAAILEKPYSEAEIDAILQAVTGSR